ncbi:MAG: flagellar biosynthetic protein FliO [Candidatus Thiodiazotropha sp. (ex. Lucinisca nassula)]|nr:flagellar biosynthetic protein FliO [Candidatus Thiodiazotropha sp. (ex. Lucinisca nassula)]MBW9260585.1 flagellar biosynthetic protein FliO [Candidatus Thiodiazotropha sp. (ex. Lucinisca nassula)]MBW9270246.1 flagellar biosynthetic protein FliO [Candidatus Thiodiazotropha sp. (ex. Lucinisca nassula)]
MCRWLLIGLFFSNALMAAEEGNKQIGVNVSPIGAEGLLNTFSGLLVVLAVIVGAAWLFKRYGQMSMGSKGMVRVLGGASVGSRERVVVVEVEDTRVLLGVAPGQVRMLHLLSDESPSFREHLHGLEQQESADNQQSEPSR